MSILELKTLKSQSEEKDLCEECGAELVGGKCPDCDNTDKESDEESVDEELDEEEEEEE